MKNETLQNTLDTISSSEWPWADSLDALLAAPRHHRRIFENDRVRVLEVHIPRVETLRVHTPCWPGVLHLQSWNEHLRRDETGKLIFDSREPPCLPTLHPLSPFCPGLLGLAAGRERLGKTPQFATSGRLLYESQSLIVRPNRSRFFNAGE